MSNTIIKTFMGTHIDLSKIVSISDAYFINNLGDTNYYFKGAFKAGFDIHIQLLDKPIHYEIDFIDREFSDEYIPPLPKHWYGSDSLIGVERLQKQVDELIQQWKDISN